MLLGLLNSRQAGEQIITRPCQLHQHATHQVVYEMADKDQMSFMVTAFDWRPMSTRDRIETVLCLVGLVYAIMAGYNSDVAAWGNPFSEFVPREMWFQHRLQWDPIIGCGSNLCQGGM